MPDLEDVDVRPPSKDVVNNRGYEKGADSAAGTAQSPLNIRANQRGRQIKQKRINILSQAQSNPDSVGEGEHVGDVANINQNQVQAQAAAPQSRTNERNQEQSKENLIDFDNTKEASRQGAARE